MALLLLWLAQRLAPVGRSVVIRLLEPTSQHLGVEVPAAAAVTVLVVVVFCQQVQALYRDFRTTLQQAQTQAWVVAQAVAQVVRHMLDGVVVPGEEPILAAMHLLRQAHFKAARVVEEVAMLVRQQEFLELLVEA